MPATTQIAGTRRQRMRLRVVRVHDGEGRLSPEFLTNINRGLQGRHGEGKRGSVLINVATALLFALAIGLYAVSLNAQFHYVMAVKHNAPVSWIEAVALDAGMAVFSLLALGLARAGQSARIERLFIVGCALGSGAMNLAAADAASLRSVLAYVMPPIFLAGVVDRTVAVVRRHHLGEPDASAWTALGRACLAALRLTGRISLYLLRFVVAPPSTVRGLRRSILAAAPVPEPAPRPVNVVLTGRRGQVGEPPKVRAIGSGQAGSKTARFLKLVAERRGSLAEFPLADVSRTCAELAPEVGLDPGAARTALRKAILSAQNGSAS